MANSASPNDVEGGIPSTVTIAAGKSSVDVLRFASEDALKEPTETLRLKITANSAYSIDPLKPAASASIADDVKGRIKGKWKGSFNLNTLVDPGGAINTGARLNGSGQLALTLNGFDVGTVGGVPGGGISGNVTSISPLTGIDSTMGYPSFHIIGLASPLLPEGYLVGPNLATDSPPIEPAG